MSIYKVITKRRTIRRFKQKNIPLLLLKRLVNAARLAPSAANLQPLEFIVVNEKENVSKIFPYLHWAGYISPHGIPPEGRRPVAYIIVLMNLKRCSKRFSFYDVGAAIENMILLAWERSIGCCWMQSIDRKAIRKILKVPNFCKIDSVVALGYKDESPIVEVFKNSIQYWLDKNKRLHVPKRPLKDILHKNCYGK